MEKEWSFDDKSEVLIQMKNVIEDWIDKQDFTFREMYDTNPVKYILAADYEEFVPEVKDRLCAAIDISDVDWEDIFKTVVYAFKENLKVAWKVSMRDRSWLESTPLERGYKFVQEYSVTYDGTEVGKTICNNAVSPAERYFESLFYDKNELEKYVSKYKHIKLLHKDFDNMGTKETYYCLHITLCNTNSWDIMEIVAEDLAKLKQVDVKF